MTTIHTKNFFSTLTGFTYGGEKTISTFIMMSVLFGVLVVGYLSLLTMTVSSVVARENSEKQISLVYSHIGELESTYLSEKNKVTMDEAKTLGYSDAANVNFIPREPLKNRLSIAQ